MIELAWPLESGERTVNSSRPFGAAGLLHWHNGLDFHTDRYTRVLAPAEGVVTRVRWEEAPSGLVVSIRHYADGFVSHFAHLAEGRVYVGDHVSRGQFVAYSGDSGGQEVPHLHFSLERNGELVDPLDWLYPAPSRQLRDACNVARARIDRQVYLWREQDELEAMKKHPAFIAAEREAEANRRSEMAYGRLLYEEMARKRASRYPARVVEFAAINLGRFGTW